MEVKEDPQAPEKTIPVFTVLKNGAILKNIFIVNSRDDSNATSSSSSSDEEILIVGRHPDCHIQLTHPSISRSHLEIRTIPSRQQLFVTDLSSVHGTWITDKKVEGGACVEVKEGDVIRIGGSTRIYRLHWIPLSHAYDIDNPFVPPLDAVEQEDENPTLDEEMALQSLGKTGSGDNDDLRLDVTSEGTGSLVPSEDDDMYIRTEEILPSFESPSVLAIGGDCVQTQKRQFDETSLTWEDFCVVDGGEEKESSSYSPSKELSGGLGEVGRCYELEGSGEADACEDEDTYISTNEISTASPSVLGVVSHSVQTQALQFNEDLQTSLTWEELDVVEAATEEARGSYSPSKQQSGGSSEVLCCYENEGSAETEGTGSSVPSEDEDTYIRTEEISPASPSVLALASHVNEDLQNSPTWEDFVVDTTEENPSRSYFPSKQHSGGSLEVGRCYELEGSAEADACDVRVDQYLNMMSERMESAVSSVNDDSTETENLQELARSIIEANAGYSSSCCFPSKGQIDGCIEALSLAFELAAEVEVLSTEFVTKQVMEASEVSVTKDVTQSHEDEEETEVSRQVIDVSLNSFSQTVPTLETLTEDSGGFSDVALETDSENHQTELEVSTKGIGSLGSEHQCEAAVETDGDNPQTEPALEISTEDVGGLGSELQCEVAVETDSDNPQTEPSLEISTEDVGGLGSGLLSEVALMTDCEKPQTEPTLEISTEDVGGLGSEIQSEVALETDNENLLQKSNEETSVYSRQVSAVFDCLFAGDECLSRINTEDVGVLGSENQSELALETENENLHQKSNGETSVYSRQVSAVFDCLFAGDECLSKINTEDIQSLCSSWQPLPENEAKAPSEIWNEGSLAGDQIQESGMARETEIIFDEGSSSYLSEDLIENVTQSFLLTPNKEPETDMSFGSGISEDSYSISEIEGEGGSDMGSPMPSTLAAETYEDTESIDELPSDDDDDENQENQTPQTHADRDNALAEIGSSTWSSRTLSTCNIWSRRGKDASVIQLRTNKSEGKQKQIGKQPKDQLQRKLALPDKIISLTVAHYGGEILEPEIFTPDKENLTPSSHMLRRLHDIGDIKDSKSKSISKLAGGSSSSKIPSIVDLVAAEAFSEPEIFTPDKENLTPRSHMLRRMREVGDIKDTKGSSSKATRKPFFDMLSDENVKEEKKPDLNCMSSKGKVKHEAVAQRKKAERAPFQPLLEKSTSESQLYIESSSTATAQNNNYSGIRSSSLLSDVKSKTKWTIVLDTSSLLDKESRKPLHLLQGLKGTHLVVPRTVMRELNETKRTRSLLFRRTPEIASSGLDWIEDCMVNTKWWIQLQSSSEETKATAPTPPVTPQSNVSPTFPFSFNWNSSNAPEIDSPTSQDQVLECALLYRNINSNHEKLVLISNDETLKIKAMAEGVICETAHEFYESLVNPFSERFMWSESTVRGRTWSHLDDMVLRERYNNRTCFPYRKKSTFNNGVRGDNGAASAKGLKLILLHNSQYGHNYQ